MEPVVPNNYKLFILCSLNRVPTKFTDFSGTFSTASARAFRGIYFQSVISTLVNSCIVLCAQTKKILNSRTSEDLQHHLKHFLDFENEEKITRLL